MNILYDYQIFQMQKTGGISRYHADLYNGLKKKANCDIGVIYSDNFYLKDSGYNITPLFEGWEHFLTQKHFKGKGTLAYWYSRWKPLKGAREYNKEYIRDLLNNRQIDIFHPTYYNDLYDDIDLPPMVLTIHDMIYESFPEYFGNLVTIANKYKMAQKAKKIIAISQYTKDEILKYYDFLSSDVIEVVYHGIQPDIEFRIEKVDHEFPYLLFVGNRGGYKNFFFLLKAMKEIRKRYKQFKLVCVGSPFSKSENAYIQLLHLNDIVLNRGWVDDAELASLYTNAMAYVSPSLSEGFGLPLLEAMKYESPMLLSDIPVYREIADVAAIYFNPANVDSLCDAIEILMDESHKRFDLINNGSKRVQLFSKEKMQENTYNVYKNI